MKALLFTSTVLLGFASSSILQAQALVEKTNASGFTMPEFVRSETCSVYPNYVKITNRYGGFSDQSFTTTEIVKVRISEGIENVLRTATEAKLSETDNYLCDAPSTSITANYGGQEYLLFTSGGCGSNRKQREGGAAQMLRDLVDRYCPVTHDFGKQEPQF